MIYNAPSIYKQGGSGGGGYNDGGALVDGDFIKVENNSVSTYTNTSRTDLNYYLEVQSGEIINAVIELTNEYNATIHVYIVQNGLFIPLGNVGGDTVNAGDDYKINVVGNSFMLEVVTPAQANPEAIKIGDEIYKLVDINGVLWSTTDFKGVIPNVPYLTDDYGGYGTNWFYLFYKQAEINAYLSNYGARLPKSTEGYDGLRAAIGGNTQENCKKIKSIDIWNGNNGAIPGTNELGLNLKPFGYRSQVPEINYNSAGWAWNNFFIVTNDGYGNIIVMDSVNGSMYNSGGYNYVPIRFVVDI